MILYKFTSPIGVRCLQDLTIKVTPPHHLNDPFEFFPRIEGVYTEAEIEEDLKDVEVRRMVWDVLQKEGLVDFSFRDFENSFPDNKSEVIRYVKDTWSLKTEAAARQSAAFFGQGAGLYCLTANHTHQLMWSHYADSHRGLVFGIDADQLEHGSNALKVDYSTERAPLNHRSSRDPQVYHELVAALAITKSRDWAYEEEYRVLFDLKDCSARQGADNVPLYFYAIEPGVIVKVILGSQISRSTAKSVATELTKPHFSHVPLERSVLHKDQFAVEFHATSVEELEMELQRPDGEGLMEFPWSLDQSNNQGRRGRS